MRPTVFVTVIITLAGGGSVSAQEDKEAVAGAGQTYRTRCVSCHQPPDLSFATDRAWLDQVNRTG